MSETGDAVLKGGACKRYVCNLIGGAAFGTGVFDPYSPNADVDDFAELRKGVDPNYDERRMGVGRASAEFPLLSNLQGPVLVSRSPRCERDDGQESEESHHVVAA